MENITIEIREPITGPEFLRKGMLLDKFQKYPVPAGCYDVQPVKTFMDRTGRPVQVVRLVPHQHQFESRGEPYHSLTGDILQLQKCRGCGEIRELVIGHRDIAPVPHKAPSLRYEVEIVPERTVEDFVLVADQDEMEMVETGTHKVPAHWLVKVFDQYGNLLGHGKGPDEATARKRAESMLSAGQE